MTTEQEREQARSLLDQLAAARRLDLGSGPRAYRPADIELGDDLYLGIDQRVFPGIVQFDLASGDAWPFADEQMEALFSSHLIEHLPAGEVRAHEFWDDVLGRRSSVPGRWQRSRGNQDALFWFMDEAWRITKPGGRFELHWPALVDRRPNHGYWCLGPFMDPTHRRFIPFETISLYCSAEGRAHHGVSNYDVRCNWIVREYGQGELAPGLIEERVVLERGPAPTDTPSQETTS